MRYMNEETYLKAIEFASLTVHKTNEINKRIINSIIIITITFGVVLTAIAGFYFLGQGYPDYSQTISKDSVQQTVKGSD